MILRIRPELVDGLEETTDVPFGTGFAPAHRAWVTKDRTARGHIGDPRSATADKGEVCFRAFAADVVRFLRRVVAWDGTGWDA